MAHGEFERVRFSWKIGLAIAAVLSLAACGPSGSTVSNKGLLSSSSGLSVTSISPNSGPLAGGTLVTITGTGFSGGSGNTAPSVTFGGAAAANVNLASSTQITATTPRGTAGAVNVVVTISGGQSATLTQGYRYVSNAPTVTGISPSSGTSSGGTVVTIAGSNFDAGTSVSFGGSAASKVTLQNSSQLTATTPAHTAGTVDVTVTTSTGLSATLTNGFTFSAGPPSVTAVSPATGPTGGGTLVTITGSNFQSGATVAFGQIYAAAVQFVSSTQLQATTPSEAAGLVDVTVTNPDGQSSILKGAFTFIFHSVSLSWTASTSTVVGYNIYRSTVSGGPYTKVNSTPVSGTTYTDQTVLGNTTYYYVATAVSSTGSESTYSNQVSASVPGP